ncbi:unnamed protein product [Zymoseptoria tritici ST99CH_3D7]|uniref:Uncharacterized protein n=1 Tax=Zymoseptoria tritici (strain ST99CH_3D7) TaxID=1276538 RepID=A0A1X7RK98_ZYMT9|nr:unnamed protein product [Zymoseptoria tritici ST99CH_3D7]
MASRKRKAESMSPEAKQQHGAAAFKVNSSDEMTVKDFAMQLQAEVIALERKHANLIATHKQRIADKDKTISRYQNINRNYQTDLESFEQERNEAREALTSGLARAQEEKNRLEEALKRKSASGNMWEERWRTQNKRYKRLHEKYGERVYEKNDLQREYEQVSKLMTAVNNMQAIPKAQELSMVVMRLLQAVSFIPNMDRLGDGLEEVFDMCEVIQKSRSMGDADVEAEQDAK